jgi:hypothetical protein
MIRASGKIFSAITFPSGELAAIPSENYAIEKVKQQSRIFVRLSNEVDGLNGTACRVLLTRCHPTLLGPGKGIVAPRVVSFLPRFSFHFPFQWDRETDSDSDLAVHSSLAVPTIPGSCIFQLPLPK